MWLSPMDFVPLTLPSVSGAGVMLPSSPSYPENFVIGYVENELCAVFVGDRFKYEIMKCSEATSWEGLYFSDARFEVDVSTVIESRSSNVPTGSILRRDNKLFIVGQDNERGFSSRRCLVLISENLSPSNFSSGVAFTRWRSVIGNIDDPKTLLEVNSATD